MKVSVKLLATFRSKLPHGSTGNVCVIELPEDCMIEELLDRFEISFDQSNVVLVNGIAAEANQRLSPGDEVCVYSAIAGG